MKTATVSQVQAHLNDYLKSIKREPVIVTRNGKPTAVLLAITDEEDLETLLLSRSMKLRRILANGRKQIAKGETMSSDELWPRVTSRIQK